VASAIRVVLTVTVQPYRKRHIEKHLSFEHSAIRAGGDLNIKNPLIVVRNSFGVMAQISVSLGSEILSNDIRNSGNIDVQFRVLALCRTTIV